MKPIRLLALAISIAILAPTAQAAVTISIGNILLQPNQANQIVDVYINAQGGEQIEGIALRAQEGDGGLGVGGTDVVPAMSGDLIGVGSIWEFNNTGVSDGSSPPGYLDLNTTTQSGFITLSAGNNRTGFLFFDTTGLYSGTWPLLLTGTVGGDTTLFVGPECSIQNGSISIVPEPGTIILAALGLVGLAAWGWRRKR